MKLIGLRRALVLLFLLVLNLAVVYVYLGVMEPMREAAENDRNGMLGQISDLRSRIENVKNELVLFKQNLPKFEALQKRGFFLEQDRFKIGRDLGDVRTLAGLRGFSYNVNDITKIDNGDAQAIQMRLIDSRITVAKVVSFLDSDFYTFVDMMNEAFPSHVRLQSFSVKRAAPLNEASLSAISQNQSIELMQAEAVFDWITVVPDVPPATGGQL